MDDREADDFTIELAHTFALLSLPERDLTQEHLKLVLQALYIGLDSRAFTLGEFFKHLRFNHLTPKQRGQGQPDGGAYKSNAFAESLLLKRFECVLLSMLEFFLNDFLAVPIFFGFKGGRNGGAQFVYQALHIAPK